LANVLFQTRDDVIAGIRRRVARINGRGDTMGFMFNHTHLQKDGVIISADLLSERRAGRECLGGFRDARV
jgi:hypothetical protein